MTTETTLTYALTASERSITLDSGTLHVGDLVAIAAEYANVLTVLSATQALIKRGVNGTSATAHDAGATVTMGRPGDFLTGPQTLPAFGDADTVLTGQGPSAAAVFAAGGGGGTAAAPDTSIQFNDGGAFAGDAALTFDVATSVLTLDTLPLARSSPTGFEDVLLIGADADKSFGIKGPPTNGNSFTITGGAAADTSGATYFGADVVIRGGSATPDGGSFGQLTVGSGSKIGGTATGGSVTIRPGNGGGGTDGDILLTTRTGSGGWTVSGTTGDLSGSSGQVLQLGAVPFASLPASPAAGMLAYVSDADTVVWGATIAGLSTNDVLAFYNGTVWTVAGK